MLVIGSASSKRRPITVLLSPALRGISGNFQCVYPMLNWGGRIVTGIWLSDVLFRGAARWLHYTTDAELREPAQIARI
jgi:hypothetical protein